MISMSYSSNTSSWKPRRRVELIFTKKDIYNSNLEALRKFGRSRGNTTIKIILPWNTSYIIPKTISAVLYDEQEQPSLSFKKSQWK